MRNHWTKGLIALLLGALASLETTQTFAQNKLSDPLTASIATNKPLYLDADADLDERVADLVSRLTLEEKAMLLDHRGPTVERFNIRSDQWNQCLNGVKWTEPTTLFPSCIAMGATWDPDLIHQVADTLSDEARAIYNGWKADPHFKGEHKGLIYRAPVINISRNPYWGRIHETYSEDPFLCGRMAVAYVQGLQGDDSHYLKIAATLKHFAVNNVESDRTRLNAKVPERWLHEYWLPHWYDAVVEGKACSLMASYNAVNVTPNNINHWLLTDLLKKEWGHEGFVVSDLGGVQTMVEGHAAGKMSYVDAVAKSIMAGCDFSDKEYRQNIPGAVRQGKLDVARLNDAVSRVLRVRFRLGEFDPQERLPWHSISPSVIDSSEHRAVALQAAQESIVLLKNKGALLPLDKSAFKKIAVIGPHANMITLNNYSGKHVGSVTALQGLKERAPGIEFIYALGGIISNNTNAMAKYVNNTNGSRLDLKAELKNAVEAAKSAEVALVFVGTDDSVEQEGRDRKTLALTGNQEQLIEAVTAANPRTILVQMSAGPLCVPWAKTNVPAILQAWWPGGQGGYAIADVLFGDVNPAGRLPYTVYASDAQVPPQDEYDISKGFTYMFVKGEPLWPFGHGLSYTTFKYRKLDVDLPNVSIDVRNTGKRAGDEVVQLYVRALNSSVTRPARELRGFSRIHLEPGEQTTVSFALPKGKLAFWDDKIHNFRVEPGNYEVQVGASSADIRASEAFDVNFSADDTE